MSHPPVVTLARLAARVGVFLLVCAIITGLGLGELIHSSSHADSAATTHNLAQHDGSTEGPVDAPGSPARDQNGDCFLCHLANAPTLPLTPLATPTNPVGDPHIQPGAPHIQWAPQHLSAISSRGPPRI
jgi:hypothetical protein